MLKMLVVMVSLAALQVHTPADSVAVVTWLTGTVGQWLGFLPEPMRAALIAAVVGFAFGVLERLVLWGVAQFPSIAPIVDEWKAGHVVAGGVNWKRFVNAVAVWLLGWWMTGNPLGGVLAAGLRSMVKAPSARPGKSIALIVGFLLVAAPGAQAQTAAALPELSAAPAVKAPVSKLGIATWTGPGPRFSFAPGAGVRYDDLAGAPTWWFGGQIGFNASDHLAARVRLTWDTPGKHRPRGEVGLWVPF
jgi:hypothetical protein